MVLAAVSADSRLGATKEARHEPNPRPPVHPHPDDGAHRARPDRPRPGRPVLRHHLGLARQSAHGGRRGDAPRRARRPARLLRPPRLRRRWSGHLLRLVRRPVRVAGVLRRQGDPVPVRGAADLQIVLRAPAHDLDYNPTFTPANPREVVNVAGYDTFRQVAWAGSFEGQTTL